MVSAPTGWPRQAVRRGFWWSFGQITPDQARILHGIVMLLPIICMFFRETRPKSLSSGHERPSPGSAGQTAEANVASPATSPAFLYLRDTLRSMLAGDRVRPSAGTSTWLLWERCRHEIAYMPDVTVRSFLATLTGKQHGWPGNARKRIIRLRDPASLKRSPEESREPRQETSRSRVRSRYQ